MDPIHAVIAMLASCTAMVSPVVTTAIDPDHAPAEEYVYAVDGVLCTAMRCMLDDDLGATMCCVRAIHATFPYRPTRKTRTKTTAIDAEPERLTPADVKAGLAAVRPRIDGCRDRYGGRDPRESVKVRVRITPEGATAEVTVVPREDEGEARHPAFERCVVTAMARARFRRSQTGATFSYPVWR